MHQPHSELPQVKVVYRDGNTLRIIKGKLLDEDDIFITIECEHNNYRINKHDINTVKEVKP